MTTGIYTPAARILHWLVAFCIAVTVPVGLAMVRTPDGPFTDALFEVHKSLGIIIFVVMMVRLAVRLVNGAPPPAQGLTAAELWLSRIVHVALYAVLIALPIGGYVATASCCAPVKLFWTIPVPVSFALSEDMTNRVFKIHELGGFVLIGLVILHVAGALNHALVKRDEVLQRMWAR